ncbi:hypothetical protein TeGR_g4063 [Tetraparma gracilis]|uniref:RRM domain-containing protein n=1 Tax=Tetraparma gracilis TaxID=2962635 RepID=A0ABQ6NBA9_9STRA|nr:hypothetical protein TeGR_g4063 [Tetraparma gracilis]
MSAFGQRLLDPSYLASRASSILTPTIDPLDDTFLQQFGDSVKNQSGPSQDASQDADVISIASSDDDDEENASHPSSLSLTSKPEKVRYRLSNLSYRTTEQAIRRVLEDYGEVDDISLLPSATAGQNNSGRCYVTFLDRKSAEGFFDRAVNVSGGIVLDGRKLAVEEAHKIERTGPRGGALGGR